MDIPRKGTSAVRAGVRGTASFERQSSPISFDAVFVVAAQVSARGEVSQFKHRKDYQLREANPPKLRYMTLLLL